MALLGRLVSMIVATSSSQAIAKFLFRPYLHATFVASSRSINPLPSFVRHAEDDVSSSNLDRADHLPFPWQQPAEDKQENDHFGSESLWIPACGGRALRPGSTQAAASKKKGSCRTRTGKRLMLRTLHLTTFGSSGVSNSFWASLAEPAQPLQLKGGLRSTLSPPLSPEGDVKPPLKPPLKVTLSPPLSPPLR